MRYSELIVYNDTYSLPLVSSFKLTWEDYLLHVEKTKSVKINSAKIIIYALFGEVGSIMSAYKKYKRDTNSYKNYKDDINEELGDILWYLIAASHFLSINLESLKLFYIFDSNASENLKYKSNRYNNLYLDNMATNIGNCMSRSNNSNIVSELTAFIDNYILFIKSIGFNFSRVLYSNYVKSSGEFLKYDYFEFENFGEESKHEDENFPKKMKIRIVRKSDDKVYLKYGDVFIGSPLTDNIEKPDAYAFHDVLHFANVAILHWSPTMRGLLKRKRKSDKKMDEAQDSGRAIVVDEGVNALIFSYAKEYEYFENMKKVPSELLKLIKLYVKGYEVERCPLSLWNHSILEGYKIFRQVKKHKQGTLIIDTVKRTISFKPDSKNDPA